MKTMPKNIVLLIAIPALIGISIFIYQNLHNKSQLKKIDNFDKCKDAGYPIMESFPEQCKTPDGRTFIRVVSSQDISVTGEMVCLPHKNKGEVQTLECAFGIKDSSGNHYALSDPEFKYITDLPMNTKLTIKGKFKNAADTKYDTLGTIEVESVER